MSPSKLRVGAVRDKGTRLMHARTFLGDDDDFSNLRGGWFRVLVIGPHSRFVSRVGLRVRSLCLRF